MTGWDPFFSHLQGETFDTPLLELTVRIGKETYSGFGKLVWNVEGGIEIWAVTEGNLAAEIGNSPGLRVGQLMDPASYYSFEATEARGYRVSVDRLTFQNSAIGNTTVRTANQYSLQSPVRFEQKLVRDVTGVSSQSIFELAVAQEVQWLCGLASSGLRTTIGSLNLVPIRAGLFSVSLASPKGIAPDRAIDSIWHAIGMVTGLRARQCVSRVESSGSIVESIPPKSVAADDDLLPVLGYAFHRHAYLEPRHAQRLLVDCINYFYTSDSDRIRSYLWAMWNAADRSFSVSTLVASSVLEGLVQKLRKEFVTVEAISPAQIEAILNFVKGEAFPRNGMQEADVEALLKRVNGALKAFNKGGTANILKAWCEVGKFNLEMEVYYGWNLVRNEVSHGTLNLFEADAERRKKLVDARTAIWQGINSILLHLVGYEGDYFDAISGTYKTKVKSP